MSGDNSELEQFAVQIEQEQRIQKRLQEISNQCWDICVTSPNSTSLDSRTKTCLENCVNRFIDTSGYILNEFAKKGQQHGMSHSEFSTSSHDSEMIKEDYNFNSTDSSNKPNAEKKGWKFW